MRWPFSSKNRAPDPGSFDMIPFKQSCLRKLKSFGWVVDVEGLSNQCRIEHNGVYARLFLIGPKEPFTVSLRYDLLNMTTRDPGVVVVILYDLANSSIVQMLKESKLLHCTYDRLDELRQYCAAAMVDVSRRRQEGLTGAIDGFEPPSTLRGWVRLRQDGQLVDGLTVVAMKNGKEIAHGEPSHLRRDICDSDKYLSGFRLTLRENASTRDILTNAISVVAKDQMGRTYLLPVWQGLGS